MSENENDQNTSLHILNVSSSYWIWRGLQAGLVKHAAMMPFYDETRKPLFWNNPANTLTYQAIYALEESCIVHICGFAQEVFKKRAAELPFAQAIDILAHRHSISHPSKSRWDRDWMQKFHDEKRYLTDFRGAIIWNLQKAINEETKNNEFGSQNTDLVISLEMAAGLRQIWLYSMNEEGLRVLPSIDKLLRQLEELKPKYIDMLERYPDGRVQFG